MNRWTLFFLLAILYACSLTGQSLPVQTSSSLDQNNNIRRYLERVASEITSQSLAGINTLQQWQEMRPGRYENFIEMLSLVDVPLDEERSPLNINIVDTIQQDGFRIIKLYYESLPQLYVPANLYIPDNVKEPLPGILYVCGHARTQKVHYQAHARRFAQLGFVCLIIETIQWGEVRGEHWGCYANGWFHWYSRGYTPAGVEVWNAIRGLDVLCSRSEVDSEKLGVTGISGGGAQSWFIAAADPRIKAVAPVCGASTVEAHIFTRTIDGHCDCMMPINTYLWDFPDIGALIAPRPLLIGQANRDGLNTMESVRQIYFKVKNIYDLYGASDLISLVETPGGHSYHKVSRQKIFSFFLKHLKGENIPYTDIDDVDESAAAQLSEEELKVYGKNAPENDRTIQIQDSFLKFNKPPAINNKEELNSFRDDVLAFLKRRTFAAFPQPATLEPQLEFRTLDGGTFGRTVYSFVSEKDWRLKIDIRWQSEQNRKNPIFVVLRNPEEKRWDSEGFVSDLQGKCNLAFFETRGVGENGWSSNLQWHVRRAAAWTGRTIASMRIYDLLRCFQFLRTLPGVNPNKICVAAQDEMTVVALYAALLDGNCYSLLLQNPPATQNIPSNPDGRGEAIEMLNCLRIIDVYQIPALLFPAKISLLNNMPDSFLWSKNVYQILDRSENFQVINSSVGERVFN